MLGKKKKVFTRTQFKGIFSEYIQEYPLITSLLFLPFNEQGRKAEEKQFK